MNNLKKNILFIIIFILVFSMTVKKDIDAKTPVESFRVFLKGEEIGLIQNKSEFMNYVNKEQKKLKDEFNVKELFKPDDLYLEKTITYDNEFTSHQALLSTINSKSSFTLSGYEIKLEGTGSSIDIGEGAGVKGQDSYIYVLDKKVFEEALKLAISPFISDEEYKAYKDKKTINLEKQLGSYVKDINFLNKIIITEKNIPLKQKIYTDVVDLSNDLLYGFNHSTQIYKVKSGDTIDDIAFANKMNTNEFLIGNPEITNKTQLLYPGQSLKIASPKPLFSFEKQVQKSEIVATDFNTELIDDDTMYKGVKKTIKEGKKGKIRTIGIDSYVNGELTGFETIYNEVLETSENAIIKVGTKPIYRRPPVSGGGNYKVDPQLIGTFVWPTDINYVITSNYGWRGSAFHDGIDIQLRDKYSGKGSNIYSIADGVIYKKYYDVYGGGNVIFVKHSDNLYTLYAHLNGYPQGLYEGKPVKRGDVIGYMGNSGRVWGRTGVHVHFSVYAGEPSRLSSVNGNSVPPLSLYR